MRISSCMEFSLYSNSTPLHATSAQAITVQVRFKTCCVRIGPDSEGIVAVVDKVWSPSWHRRERLKRSKARVLLRNIGKNTCLFHIRKKTKISIRWLSAHHGSAIPEMGKKGGKKGSTPTAVSNPAERQYTCGICGHLQSYYWQCRVCSAPFSARPWQEVNASWKGTQAAGAADPWHAGKGKDPWQGVKGKDPRTS